MYKYFVIFTLFIFLFSCTNDKPMGDLQIMDEQLKADLKTLSRARIFFGHQSVGNNIIKGLDELNREAGKMITIVEWQEGKEVPSAFFAHGLNGQNENPQSKCDAFAETLSKNFADSLDMAFFKFCYIDIKRDTDIKAMFDYYKQTIAKIKSLYPRLKIVHVSVPLRQIQSGWKASIKKLLGKPLGRVAENIKRNQFNEMLRAEYNNEAFFDLAKIESTFPDGKRMTFEEDGKTYFSLIPAYSYDGSHLNSLGAKLAAKEMVRVLAGSLPVIETPNN